jgi:hypothetical protein
MHPLQRLTRGKSISQLWDQIADYWQALPFNGSFQKIHHVIISSGVHFNITRIDL